MATKKTVQSRSIRPLTAKERKKLQEVIVQEFQFVMLEHREHMRSMAADIQRCRIALEASGKRPRG